MTRRRFLAIVNGRNDRARVGFASRLADEFRRRGVEWIELRTKRAGHAVEIARELDLAAVDAIAVVGGDGTIHEVVNGLAGRDDFAVAPPLALFPGGTGNAVVEHMGTKSLDAAIERALHGDPRPVDLMRVESGAGPTVETRWCLNIAGWGAAVDINLTAESLRWLGSPRYALAALTHVALAKRRDLQLSLDGVTHDGPMFFVMACNTRFTGKGMLLAPEADWCDGEMDVVIVRQASRWEMLRLFQRVFDGSHAAMPCVEIRRAKTLSLHAATPSGLNLDGELTGTTPATATVAPGRLRVLH